MLQKNIRKLFRTVYNVDTRVIMHNEKRILVPLRVTRSGSVFSLILLTFRNIHNVKLSFAIA